MDRQDSIGPLTADAAELVVDALAAYGAQHAGLATDDERRMVRDWIAGAIWAAVRDPDYEQAFAGADEPVSTTARAIVDAFADDPVAVDRMRALILAGGRS